LKITKQLREQCWKVSGHGTVAAHHLHAPPQLLRVGSRAAVKSRERGEIFTFLLAVSNAVTCKIPKTQQASLF